MDNIGRFNNYTILTAQVADFSYKMGQVRRDSNDQLITQLKSEIRFLRDESREN